MIRRIPALTLVVCSWSAAQTAPQYEELDRRLLHIETERIHGNLAAAETQVAAVEADIQRAEGPGFRLAAALRLHGLLRDDADRAREAIPFYERALALLRAQSGATTVPVALVQGNLAGSLADMGKFDQALSLSGEAIRMLDAAGQRDGAPYAVALSAHAMALHGLGRNIDALRDLRAAASILQRVDLPDNPHLALVTEGIGACLFDLGYAQQAEAAQRQARDLRVKIFGPNSLSVAVSTNNLAVMLAREQRYSEGRQLLEQAVQVIEQLGEARIQRLDVVLGNLGRLYAQEAHSNRALYAKAEDAFRRQLAIEERLYGDSDVRVSATLESLGEVLYSQRSYNEAGRLYGRGLALQQSLLGASNPAARAAAKRYSVLAKKMTAAR